MRRILIIVLTYVSFATFGQSSGDHLEPTEGYFNMYGHHYDYYPFIYKHLIKGLSYNTVARIVTLPSFSPENVLSIETTDNRKSYKVIYKICKKSIWYSDNRDKTNVIKYEKEVDSAIVNLIEKVFDKALLQTKYYEDFRMGLDGVNYIFSSKIKAGQVWSPKEGTKMNDLVELGELLIAFAQSDGNDDRVKLNQEIMDRGRKLLSRLSGD
jgi:hypothetical protein